MSHPDSSLEYDYDALEMTCYCDYCKCVNQIKYKHQHDWGKEEDYVCNECLEKHKKYN